MEPTTDTEEGVVTVVTATAMECTILMTTTLALLNESWKF
jgi:hypothetical protein